MIRVIYSICDVFLSLEGGACDQFTGEVWS